MFHDPYSFSFTFSLLTPQSSLAQILFTMNHSISSILVLFVVVAASFDRASGFATIQRSPLASKRLLGDGYKYNAGPSSFSTLVSPPSPPSSSSITALNLKVKIDPEASKKKGNKNVAGNAKMAAYGGSVVIALMLPIAFLVWSAVSK
jgi:hypothetical protein